MKSAVIAVAPRVMVGTRTVPLAAEMIAGGATCHAPVVTPWTALLAANFISGGAQAYGVVIDLPAHVIAVNTIAASGQVRTPSVSRGAVTIAPPLIGAAGGANAVEVSLSLRQYMHMESIVLTAMVFSVTVARGQRVNHVIYEKRVVDILAK